MAKPIDGRATVREIAAHLGLSAATVSRAMNGHGYISDETRRRVQEAVEQFSAHRPMPRPRPRAQGTTLVRCPLRT